jgi:hypothetical protein
MMEEAKGIQKGWGRGSTEMMKDKGVGVREIR